MVGGHVCVSGGDIIVKVCIYNRAANLPTHIKRLNRSERLRKRWSLVSRKSTIPVGRHVCVSGGDMIVKVCVCNRVAT